MAQGIKATMDSYSMLAYGVAVELAGGEDNLSQEQLDSMAQVCATNQNIRTFAGMYLVGSSERSQYNFNNLLGELRRVFKLNN